MLYSAHDTTVPPDTGGPLFQIIRSLDESFSVAAAAMAKNASASTSLEAVYLLLFLMVFTAMLGITEATAAALKSSKTLGSALYSRSSSGEYTSFKKRDNHYHHHTHHVSRPSYPLYPSYYNNLYGLGNPYYYTLYGMGTFRPIQPGYQGLGLSGVGGVGGLGIGLGLNGLGMSGLGGLSGYGPLGGLGSIGVGLGTLGGYGGLNTRYGLSYGR